MNILVTGSNGFVGKNLINQLRAINNKEFTIFECDIDTSDEKLDLFCKDCDFVYHLAGVNRPLNDDEFMSGNYDFADNVLNKLIKYNNKAPIMLSSSIQSDSDNLYGKSKKEAEKLFESYAKHNNGVFIYKLPNVFGKWCKPNYNSVVATFCYNIARGIDITINDKNVELSLVYIDDVIKSLLSLLKRNVDGFEYCYIDVIYKRKLGLIADLINSFKVNRNTLNVIDTSDEFTQKLYSTYLSYLPLDSFSYPVRMNVDDRGSFTELLKTNLSGQFSVNISKPGITKGNHWHNSKNEKFIVVSGEALIQFKSLYDDSFVEYKVSGEKIEVIDIPTGYTHNIINIGDSDLITFIWCNELFDQDNPDTYYEEVIK